MRKDDVVWLPNGDLGRPTLHEFIGTRPCVWYWALQPGYVTRQEGTAVELLYRCLETGTVRRYGCE